MNPADDLFARVIRHNKLLSGAEIDQAIADYESKVGAGGDDAPDGFAKFLVDSELISEKVRGAVEKALEKRRAVTPSDTEKAPPGASQISAGVVPQSPPAADRRSEEIRKKRAWKPRSKRMAEAMEDRQRDPAPEVRAGAHATASGKERPVDLDAFIRRCIPSRVAQRFLQYCVDRGIDVFSEQDVTRMISVPPGTAREICNNWVRRGMIKKIGEGTYNFAPAPKLRTEIDAFFEAWKDDSQHSDLMRKIMQHERS